MSAHRYRQPHERAGSLNEEPRHLDGTASGDAARDGYTTIGRRPRVGWIDEPVEPSRADEIEEISRMVREGLDD